jgi:hypothetical protein
LEGLEGFGAGFGGEERSVVRFRAAYCRCCLLRQGPIRCGLGIWCAPGWMAFRRIGEAIGAARHSVWLTVAFYAEDFCFPGAGRLFDVLDDAVGRGLDVRVLFWRPDLESAPTAARLGGRVSTGRCCDGVDRGSVGAGTGHMENIAFSFIGRLAGATVWRWRVAGRMAGAGVYLDG